MKIVSGVDIVYLPGFKKSLKNGGENFLRRVFHETELRKHDVQHLAGIFAAKEAIMKALSLPTDCWLDIQITHESDGVPKAQIENLKLKIENCSLSISHDGSYIITQFVALLR